MLMRSRADQEQQRVSKALAQMTSHATLLTLVRHGETDWNIEHRLQGQLQPGPSLNATGQQQAALVAACLATKHVDALYASDLARAQETLRIIHKTLPDGTHVGEPLPSLRERALGVAEGLTWQQLPARCPAAMVAIQRDGADSTHGVEALGAFRQRAVRALVDIAAAHPGAHVVIVTHGGFLSCISHHCARQGLPSRAGASGFVNGSVSKVKVQGEVLVPLQWNDTLHLEALHVESSAQGGGAEGG